MRVKDLFAIADCLIRATSIADRTLSEESHAHPVSLDIRSPMDVALTEVEDALVTLIVPWVEFDVWAEFVNWSHKASQPERIARLRTLKLAERT